MTPKKLTLLTSFFLVVLAAGVATYRYQADSEDDPCASKICDRQINPPFSSEHEGQMQIRPASKEPEPWITAQFANINQPGAYEIRHAQASSIGLSDEEAIQLAQATLDNAHRQNWHIYDEGLKDGFMLMEDLDALHYMNYEYMTDGETLNPRKPEALMYYPTGDGMALVGVMFLASSTDDPPPHFQNPNINWHFHVGLTSHCQKGPMTVCTLPNGHCPEGYEESFISATMLHIWFVDHPRGPFSTSMVLPDKVLPGIGSQESYNRAEDNRLKIYKLQKKLGNSRDPYNVTRSETD
ncbi:MAG: hypothetical protein ACQES2_11280 [Pseudomonadota bacterium]